MDRYFLERNDVTQWRSAGNRQYALKVIAIKNHWVALSSLMDWAHRLVMARQGLH